MSATEILDRLKVSVADGREVKARELAEQALKIKIDPLEVLKAASAGMLIIGEKYSRKEVFVPEAAIAAAAFHAVLDVITPELRKVTVTKLGKVVIGSGLGDVHDVGKNLVKLMLEASGFEVYDLGRNVPAEKFIDKAIEVDADIIAVSALYTPTMLDIKRLMNLLKEKDLERKFKVMIGGGATSPALASELGFFYAEDMYKAVLKAKEILGGK
jgi:dimethylamine corrinoid protein